MKHISIDLETMGIGPNSAIIAIGAVEFELPFGDEEPKYGETFYVNVDLQSCLDAGLSVDASTVMWWLEQSDAARFALTDPNKPMHTLRVALDLFVHFWSQRGAEYVWARGQDFDITLMNNAFAKFGMSRPWKYNKARDSRTLYHGLGFDGDAIFAQNTDGHNALSDACWEAKAICAAFRQRDKNSYRLALLERKAAGAEEPGDEIMRKLIGEEGRVLEYDCTCTPHGPESCHVHHFTKVG